MTPKIPISIKKGNIVLESKEFFIIFLIVGFLILFAVLRFEQAYERANIAKTKSELEKIYRAQTEFYKKSGTYGSLWEIGYHIPMDYHGISYTVESFDQKSFIAMAYEDANQDPFGDGVAGNEVITLDWLHNFSKHNQMPNRPDSSRIVSRKIEILEKRISSLQENIDSLRKQAK
jgi:hypothetical protein